MPHNKEWYRYNDGQFTTIADDVMTPEEITKHLNENTNKAISNAEKITELERIIKYCYDACRCERFETYGFDYHETHPVLGNKVEGRNKTPKVMIEGCVGFKWDYSQPDGCCDSKKVLTFDKYDG